MKMHIMLFVVFLVLCAGLVDAAVVYDESSQGDLSNTIWVPDFVESNPALRNDINGSVGGSGDLADTFWFSVPVGSRLVEIELVGYTAAGGNDTTYFGLYEGSEGVDGDEIFSAVFGPSDIGSGLLALGGLASQPSGDYSIKINDSIAGQIYSVRIHLEAYRFDEETMDPSGLNGDWNDGSPTSYPWLPISVRGSQFHGTVGGGYHQLHRWNPLPYPTWLRTRRPDTQRVRYSGPKLVKRL